MIQWTDPVEILINTNQISISLLTSASLKENLSDYCVKLNDFWNSLPIFDSNFEERFYILGKWIW